MTPFTPLVRNAHLATIAANFWPRSLDENRFPVEARLFDTEPGVRILVHVQRPPKPKAEVVLVHGLEGSSRSRYMCSLAQILLEAGYAVHRTNIRTCGGTGSLCSTVYHAGLTTDLAAYLEELRRQRRAPVFLAGYSLGGNMVLKLAGERGESAAGLLAGVATVSTPLDLKACSLRLGEPANRLYSWWFLRSMLRGLKLRHRMLGDRIPVRAALQASSIYELDDLVTGPAFGFTGADHYYRTQSAENFLPAIRVPTLLIQAKNDPLIPFAVYENSSLARNPRIRLVAPDHGGHVAFLSRGQPRVWTDAVILDWISRQGNI